jgi:hypothetical protein
MRSAAYLSGLVLSLGALSSLAAQQPAATPPADVSGRIEIAEPAFGAYVGSTLDMAAAVWATGASTTSSRNGLHWQSSDVLTAWITDRGTLTLFKPGPVTLTVSYGKITASTTIDVLPNPAEKLEISGDAQAEVRVGTPIRLNTRVTAAGGTTLADARVNYAVAAGDLLRNPMAAQITDDGVFTASEPGVYTVIAEFGGVADHLTMLIGQPGVVPTPASDNVRSVEIDAGAYSAFVGTTIPLAATVMRRGEKTPVDHPRLHWRTSNDDVAWVASNGVVVFEAPGRVTITVEHGTKTASHSFLVSRNPAAKLVLSTNVREVMPGDTVPLTTNIWARGSELVRGARVNYGVIARSPEAVGGATVLEDGRFVATRPGVYTIVAEFGGLADTRTIMVQPRMSAGRKTSR